MEEEESATAMDVEEQQPPSNPSSSSNRVGLKNSIQTNFGDDYVFQIVPKYRLFGLCFSSHRFPLNFHLIFNGF